MRESVRTFPAVRPAVLGPGRPSETSATRLGNTGRAEQVGSDVPEPPADSGRGEAFGPGRLLPGATEASGQASLSWVCATTRSQVQRSAASGVRSFGVAQPSVCFANLKVCSRSNTVTLLVIL